MRAELKATLAAILPGLILPLDAVERNRTMEAPNIEQQVRDLKHHGDPLGFSMLDEFDPDNNMGSASHWASVIRDPRPGVPYLYLGNTQFVEDGTPGARVAVVRFGSRRWDGERLRSNLLSKGDSSQDTLPFGDRHVVTVRFDGDQRTGGFAFEHVGGMAMIDDVLLVPLEDAYNGTTHDGALALVDMRTPEAPVVIHEFPLTHKAAWVAVHRLSDGRYLFLIPRKDVTNDTRDNRVLRLYTTNVTDLRAPNLALNATFGEWDERGAGNSDPEIPSDWESDGTFTWEGDTPAIQNAQVLRDSASNTLYLLGTSNDFDNDNLGTTDRDWLDLFTISFSGTSAGQTPAISGIRHILRYRPSIESATGENRADFQAGANPYVTPSGQLILYAHEHDNDGAKDEWGKGTVKMIEYSSHTRVSHGPQPGEAWVDLYDGDGGWEWDNGVFQGKVLTFDRGDADREDLQDLRKHDSFSDKADSAVFYIPNGGRFRLHQDELFGGGSTDLVGNGTVQKVHSLPLESITSVQWINTPEPERLVYVTPTSLLEAWQGILPVIPQTGDLPFSYQSVAAGILDAGNGEELRVRGGFYNESFTANPANPVTITTIDGPITIGTSGN